MEEADIKRKLATILVADIVGYSRLTANDEDWTIRALGDFRKIVDDIIARHDGRIFSTGGDSVLAEFASPVEAVRCAVDFQEASRSRNLLQPRDRQLRYRIGINLGDVMVRGTDLLGDGVNVAARLEGIAEPGGICVSASVWEHINGKLSIGYVDIGEQSVKNIPRPVRAYHLRVDGSVGEVAEAGAKPQPAADAPGATAKPRVPMAAILGGAIVIILVLAGVLAWQMWPKSTTQVATAPSAPAPAISAPATPETKPAPITIPPTPATGASDLVARLASIAPTTDEKFRADLAQTYKNAKTHKSIAGAPNTSYTHWIGERPSADNARESALELCQFGSGQPCATIAVDDTPEALPSDGRWRTQDMPRLRYSGEFDPAQMFGVWPELRQRPEFTGYRGNSGPKAVAFHLAGGSRYFVGAGPDQHAAEAAAFKACDADNPNASPALRQCYLYAAGDRVVLPLRLKEPMTPAPAAAAPNPTPTAPAPAPQPSVASHEPPKTFRDCPNCPEMVVIPPGTFQMGAAPGENERLEVPSAESVRDAPQHQVTFAKPFALAKFDITRGEFAAFAKATGFRPRPGCQTVVGNTWTPQPRASWEEPGYPQTERDPVVCMNQLEIGSYLAWLHQQTGKDYRLPSEAEWEYAQRGGTTTAFYWGDDAKDACTYENVGDQDYGQKYNVESPVPCRDGFSDLAPVGSFKPNPFGLYDMAGNIFVLLSDCWNETYAGAPSDGSAWLTGDCMRHVTRKAAFGNPHPWMFRSANRSSEGMIVKRNRVGFRVALSLP